MTCDESELPLVEKDENSESKTELPKVPEELEPKTAGRLTNTPVH
jgi:hypothetical protein